MKVKKLLSLVLALTVALSGVTVFRALADTQLLAQYTFENGMPDGFTPASFDGVVKKPKVAYDEERGYVLRQYFGAGTGSGDGAPQGESYVSVAENPYAGCNTENGVTFMLWTKTTEDAPWDYNDTLLSFNNSTTRFALNNCPYLNYNINGDNQYKSIFTEIQQSVKGVWKHFAFTVAPDGIRIFSDGAEVACRSEGNLDNPYAAVLAFLAEDNTSLNLGLGGFFGSQDCFMDDLRFYKGVLTDEEIFDIYSTTVDFTTKNTKSISHAGIHDPSIVTCYILEDGTQVGANDPRAAQAVDKRWWAFGSHMGVAYSDDLINWHNYAGGFDENNPVINYTDDNGNKVKFTDMLTYDLGYHGDITGMWAGCAIWLPTMNKWALYGSCTSVLETWGYNSVLWVMYADNIEGPYKDPQPMVFTNPSFDISHSKDYIARVCPDGANYTEKSWWNNTWRTTHTVDPTAFYDKEGDLWMIYGSYNSLFILPMDENTGLPDYEESYERERAATDAGLNHYENNDWKSDWYWGTRINYTNYATDWTGEGSFIYYDHVTDYYYLYITYGGFASLGGYNLRVLRSRTPEGPYVDALGQDLLSELDDSTVQVNAGVKLTGNYQWNCNATAYMSPGHDSVLEETVDGVEKIFQMYHVRFNNRSEGFFDQMHQMVRTKDDWTIMLPYEYYGETVDYTHEYTPNEIAGAYEFVDLQTTTYHIKDESDYDSGSDIVLPTQHIVLSEDGKIYSAAEYKGGTTTDYNDAHQIITRGIIGTWSEDAGSCYADFTINGHRYTGVFTYQYDESKTRDKTLVFAATGNNRTIWGCKVKAAAFQNAENTAPTLEKQIAADNGTVSDESMHLYGNAAVVNDAKRGSALFLPAGEEGFATADNPYYGKALDGATITFWGKITQQANFDAANIFLSFIDNADEWRYFTLNAGPQAHLFYEGFADFYAQNVPACSTDDWHYFAFTADGEDRVNIYIDGVQIGCAARTSDGYDASAGNLLQYLAQTEKVYFGKTQQPSGAEWAWTGQECYLDNICFYSSVLTEAQMLDMMMTESASTAATTAPASISDISVDPIVYTHGTGSSTDYMYAGNTITSESIWKEWRAYLYVPDDYDLLSLASDNGNVRVAKDANGLYLKGTVNRTDTDMALTLYLRRQGEIYKKTVYTYVKNTPVDAHVAEWNCVNITIPNTKRRSLCHISRLCGSVGSGGNGDCYYLESPTDFSASENSMSGMGFTTDIGKYAGAYAYNYYTFGSINQNTYNNTIPHATYYIDKSAPRQKYWDGNQYRFTWRFTTLNGNSSAIWSTGRNVYGESDNGNVWVDVPSGVYDDQPNNGGITRDYYVGGNADVNNAKITVSITQGSSPKASVNHQIYLTVHLCDKGTLRSALHDYEALYEGSYSADSWKAFETAKRNAWAYINNDDLYDDSLATQQNYITLLEQAANQLETVDYTLLQQKIDDVAAVNPDNFTDASLARLQKKADEYTALIGFASSQAQVNRAVNKLDDLLNALVSAYLCSGTVKDMCGNPIENATIESGGITAISAENGGYRIKLENGRHTLAVSTATSVDREISAEIENDAIPGADITLVNCDLNRDGSINGRDWALAEIDGNANAKAEIRQTLSVFGAHPVYPALSLA